MSKSGIAASRPVAWCSAFAAVRPGPSTTSHGQSGRGSAEHRGLHRRRQGPRSRPGPNLVEIDLEVSASSELTADAIVKYRDAPKRSATPSPR